MTETEPVVLTVPNDAVFTVNQVRAGSNVYPFSGSLCC